MKTKLYLLTLLLLLVFSSCGSTVTTETEEYSWNNGHCSYCNGYLEWSSTGKKEHYICEQCGKEYTFDKVMSKK